MSSDSRKAMETKEKLKDAFFEIYKTKRLEKISIKEITDAAGYNRGTFYVYYTDIYDLLAQVEDELIAECKGAAGKVVGEMMQNSPVAMQSFPITFFNKNKKYLKVLLGSNGDPQFVAKIKFMFKNIFRANLSKLNIGEGKPVDFVFEYIVSAQLGIITYWMEHEDEMSVEELVKLFPLLLNKGPFGYLREL